nr:hypothetical protein [Tanacetum cinerariifolium]
MGPELIRETKELIVQIKNRLLAARSRQKSYADVRRKPLEFKMGDRVMLKVSPWKGVIRFGKQEKLTDEELVIPLDDVKIDDKLHFIVEPVEIIDREVKQLKQSRIPIVKVRWNSKRGPEYTWEREDQILKNMFNLWSLKEPEEDSVEEPEPLAGHGDQFDAHPNPQPRNKNGWVDDDDDDVEEEDDENVDVDIEEDDDAEISFPYEVQGDQTPPPRDESSDSEFKAEEADDELEVEEADVKPEVEEAGDEPKAEGADVELEAEKPDGAPEATIRTGSQRPFAFVCGLAPWALRYDLEALGRQERIREAESEKSRIKIALLGSRAKIGKIEREILHHYLSGVGETLGKVVERLKVLESEENVTLKKKLAENKMLLDLTRMERDRAEKRLSESIWWYERFYLERVREGAVPEPPSDDEGSEHPRKMPKKSDEDEGPSDPRGPLMIMPPKPMSEARMREIISDQFATSTNEFMANMNNRAGGSRGSSGSGGAGVSGGADGNADGTGVRGAGPTVPKLTGCTYATFIKYDPLPFNGTKGAVGLCQWFEKLESVIQISECKEKDRVKFSMAT